MQMNRRFDLISRDKEFSNRFSVHFLINNKRIEHKQTVVQSRDLGRSCLLLL